MSELKQWAKKEIELSRKREIKNRKKGQFDYGCACLYSALKAFNSLLEDEHNGMSIIITKQILNRLIDGKPLTPIEDTDDVWKFFWEKEDGTKVYHCNRMNSLFKYVYTDGTVKYDDLNRIICLDIKNPNVSWNSGFISKIAEKYVGEIKMPYMPYDNPIEVYVDEFLYNHKNGDYDTIEIKHYKIPYDDKIHEINRYFKESENGFVEINYEEFVKRKSSRKVDENES